MSIQPIGLLTIAIGFCCLLLEPAFALWSLAVLSLFGAAAAVFLGSGGQIPPAHLLLVFVLPAVLCRRRALGAALDGLSFPNAGFWLLCVTLLGAASAYLMPRIFEGSTDILTVAATDAGLTFLPSPLMPVGTNVTQTVYLAADLACYATVTGFCGVAGGRSTVARALLAFAALDVVFAVLDIATFYTGTAFVFDPVRNAGYMLRSDEVASGLKRIVGTFPEASSFSAATLGVLGYTGTLWLRGRWTAVSGSVAVASALLLALSTSSTAVVGGGFVFAVLYGSALRRVGRGRRGSVALAFVIAAPLLAAAVACAVLLDSTARATLGDYLSTLLLNKAASQSGVERASWNALAIRNLLDTDGLGAGLGSVHASSFVTAVAGSLGLPGCFLFAVFLWKSLALPPAPPGPEKDQAVAARNACLALLAAASISGGLVDLGLPFFLFAGLTGSGSARLRAGVRVLPAALLGSPA